MRDPRRDMEWDCLVDHPYRGIREQDPPLPGWWHWIFWTALVYSTIQATDSFREVEGEAERESWVAEAHASYDYPPALPPWIAHPRSVSPAEVAQGRSVFVKNCASCHQADGGGLIGPNLTDRYWLHGGTPRQIHRTVRDGVATRNMPAWGRVLSADRLSATVAFVLSLRGTTPAKPKGPEGVNADSASAPERLPGVPASHGAL